MCADGQVVVSADGVTSPAPRGDVVVLPAPAMRVRGAVVGELGFWLGARLAGDEVVATCLVDGQVVEVTRPALEFDVERVTAEAGVIPPDEAAAALAFLVCELDDRTRAVESVRADHEGWKFDLGQAAAELADEHNFCEVYDRFAETWDLPTRVRDYEVVVEVKGTVTVIVDARSEDDAMESVDRDLVDRRINCVLNDLEYEATEASQG